MQGLVAIELGNGDVVLELAGHGLVELVQDAQRGVAVALVRHHDAKAVHVRNLREAQMLLEHLAVDGIERFLAPGKANRHLGALEGDFNFLADLADQVATTAAGAFQRTRQNGFPPGVEVAEGQT